MALGPRLGQQRALVQGSEGRLPRRPSLPTWFLSGVGCGFLEAFPANSCAAGADAMPERTSDPSSSVIHLPIERAGIGEELGASLSTGLDFPECRGGFRPREANAILRAV